MPDNSLSDVAKGYNNYEDEHNPMSNIKNALLAALANKRNKTQSDETPNEQDTSQY